MANSETGRDGQTERKPAAGLRSPLSQTSSEQSDEGDLTKLVAQIKAAAAKKVKGRKKELLRTIETRVEAEEKKFRAESQRNVDLVAQVGDEWMQASAVNKAVHSDLLGQLLTLENQLGDLTTELQKKFLQYANHRVDEGARLRAHMRASAEEQEQTEGVAEGVQTD